MNDFLDVPKLGFGMMRLPTKDGQIDQAQVNAMADLFIGAGFSYVDTAFGYMEGKSEIATGEAFVQRHPRSSFLLATKLPPWELNEKADVERVFQTQLTRTGATYFDYYLIHAIGAHVLAKLDDLGVWDFLKKLKAEGLAKHIGFSFHDKAEVLDQVLTAHPEVEFVQLQINYADWQNPSIQAGACYDIARKHGVAVTVMEPVKGGVLANLADEEVALFKTARPDQSTSAWAMRYCASLEGVVSVLSGMSNIAQMEDNVRTLQHFEPLTVEDTAVIDAVVANLAKKPTISCTDCRYCTEHCPQNIPIPALFRLENDLRTFGTPNRGSYGWNTKNKGRASDCIACGVCEDRCPQHLLIIDLLEEVAEHFE